MLLVQILTPEETDPTYDGRLTLIDAESTSLSLDMPGTKNMKLNITKARRQAFDEALADFKKDIKEFCSKRSVDFISISSDTPIEKVLFSELLKVGIMES